MEKFYFQFLGRFFTLFFYPSLPSFPLATEKGKCRRQRVKRKKTNWTPSLCHTHTYFSFSSLFGFGGGVESNWNFLNNYFETLTSFSFFPLPKHFKEIHQGIFHIKLLSLVFYKLFSSEVSQRRGEQTSYWMTELE